MTGPLRCLHVLPTDLARGAQRYARALRNLLDGPDAEHRTLTLFDAAPAALGADFSLGVPAGRLRAAGLDPRALFHLRRFLVAHRPHVVVAHGGEPLKYAAAARPAGTALAYYKIGTAGTRLANPLRRRLHGAAVRRADVVVAVSEAAAEEAREVLRVAPDRLVVIPNGRDPAEFPSRRLPDPGGPLRLVFVGHLTRTKRPERFVAAVAALRRRGVKLAARLVGDGPLMPAVRAAARSADVEVLGARDDVPAQLMRSDVLVFPSLPEGEGMPGVLIEAAFAGVPAVATDVPGAREVVVDGETGLIVPVDDFGALVDALAGLASDPGRRERMGAAARRRAEERFTMHASASAWAALLEELGSHPSLQGAGR